MPSDFTRIKDNVQYLVDESAPLSDIDRYLGTENFTAAEFKKANENFGTLTSAIKRGGKSTGSLIADFLPAMGADLLEKIAPDSWKPTLNQYREKQMQEAAKTQQEIAKTLPAEFESYKDVQGVGDAFGYAKEAFGENLASMLPGVVTGGIGSIIGRGAVIKAGEVAGNMAKKKLLEEGLAAGLTAEAATAGANKVALEVAKKAMATKALQYEAGSTLVGSAALNMPDAYQAIYDPTNQESLLPTLASGTVNTVLDSIMPFNLLRTMKGKGIAGPAVAAAWYKRGAKELGKGYLTESTTETLQEMSNAKAEQFVKGNPEFFTPENLTRFIDANLKGGISGGAMQGATGVVFGKGPVAAPPGITPPVTGQSETTITTPEPPAPPAPVSNLTGERDLAGMVPEGRLPENAVPIIDPTTGKVTGYEAAPAGPERELVGQQAELNLEPQVGGQRDLFTETPVQPQRTEATLPTQATPAPVIDILKGTVQTAKQDPTASKILKGNNAATAQIVSDRIQGLMDPTTADPVRAMEQLYEMDKAGNYPAGVKPLTEAQTALLQASYKELTKQDIDDAIRNRELLAAQQPELFPEGGQNEPGKTEPTAGTTGVDVGVPIGQQPGGTTTGTTGAGVGGVGVDGGGAGIGGPSGGTKTQPVALTPEEAWNKHKNDDHPEFTALSPEEQKAWADAVTAGRGNAVTFQNIIKTQQKEITNKQVDESAFAKYENELRTDIGNKLANKRAFGVIDFLMNNGPEANQQIARAVNKRIKDMQREGYKFTFGIVNRPSASWAGEMDPYKVPGTMKVKLNKAHNGTDYRTATHEFVHAAGYSLIDYGKKNPTTKEGKLVAELNTLQKYIVKYLQDKQNNNPNSLTDFEKQILRSREAKYRKQEDNAFGLRTKKGTLLHEIDEMTTWGLTDGRMIATLDAIPYQNTTAGQKFVDLIRKLLGISQKHDTAFNELLRLTNALFEMPTTNTGIIPLASNSSLNKTTSPKETIVKLPDLTSLQPSPTTAQKLQNAAKKGMDTFNGDWWTTFRIKAVDQTSGLMKTLSSLPVFQENGVLRADMLLRSFNQVINLIKNGIQTGIPVINSDGSVIIMRSENNLARSQILADQLDDNPYVKASGKSGRGFVAEIARAKRGQEILKEDAGIRAEAKRQMAIAKSKRNEAASLYKNGGSLSAIVKLKKEAEAIKAKWADAVELNRELQVTQAHIDQADRWLAAVPEVSPILDIWREINMGLINLNEAAGNLSKEDADRFRSKKSYVPLFASRVDIETGKQESYTGARTSTKSVAKQLRLEGSNLTRNIWENMDKYYASATASAFQNQTRKIAVQQLASLGALRYTKADDPEANLRFKDYNHPEASNDGVVAVILDNPNDLAAFQMMHYELNPIMKGFSTTTQVLRSTALINPMYWIKQLIRDPIHATLVANSGIVTPFHSLKEYINILANNSEEVKLLASRGVIGQIDSTIDLHNFLNQVGTERLNPSMLAKSMHKIMALHEASDAATRVALYKKAYAEALQQGMSKTDAENFAVHKTRESINFSTRGNSKTLNSLRHMIPFLSASIVSLDTLYRAATGYGLNPVEKKAAQQLFVRRAAMMAVLSTAYAMMLQDDEDYKKLPDNVKDNNWLFPSPIGSDHTFVKVAVPFEVGFFFKTIPEVSVRYMAGTSTGKEMLASIIGGIKHNLPGEGILIPQAAKPALEAITNHSWFTGRPIEGMSDQGLPVAQRGPNASEFSKTLSSFGLDKIGLSPAKLDHLIQGYTAELGTFTTGLAGSAINAATGKEPPDKNIEQQPFFKSFLTNPNTSKAASDYYELSHNAQETVNAFNRLKTTGHIEEAKEFIANEDNKKLMAAAPALRRVGDQMAKVRAQINRITADQSKPSDVRRDEINRLQTMYDRIARQGTIIAASVGIER